MSCKAQSGFTFIELLVVVIIVGVLASVALPLADLTARRAKEEELRNALRQIRNALDAHKKAADEGRIEKAADASGYPVSLDVLVQGVRASNLPDGRLVYFLRRVPRDPFAAPGLGNAKTWGLRSHASPPDKPEPGADVFDVHSLSDEIGLNGIAYREW